MSRALNMIFAAKVRLEEAQVGYRRTLESLDKQLQHAVTLDPSLLEDAQAVQSNYRIHYLEHTLHEAQQPLAAPALGPDGTATASAPAGEDGQ